MCLPFYWGLEHDVLCREGPLISDVPHSCPVCLFFCSSKLQTSNLPGMDTTGDLIADNQPSSSSSLVTALLCASLRLSTTPCSPRPRCTTSREPTWPLEPLLESSSVSGESFLHSYLISVLLLRPSYMTLNLNFAPHSVMTIADQGDSDLLTIAEGNTE